MVAQEPLELSVQVRILAPQFVSWSRDEKGRRDQQSRKIQCTR